MDEKNKDLEGASSEEPAPEEEEGNEGKAEKEGKEEGKKKRKRRRWPIVLLIVFVMLFLVAYGFYEYSYTPAFCNSCHIMKPYYDAWAGSSHKSIPCVECHISPKEGAKWDAKIQGILQVFKYVTRTYSSKPYAEIDDGACLRSGCHGERLVENYSTEEFKNHVVFDHRPHLTGVRLGRRLRCTSCHAQMVVGTHMEVTTSTCYLCHFKGSDSEELKKLSDCRTCHKKLPDKDIEHKVFDPTDPTRVIDTVTYNHEDFIADKSTDCRSCHVNSISGTGEAKRDRCLDCHNVPEHLARFDDLPFIHDNHTTKHNVPCERCHEPILHQTRTQTLGMEQSCQRCHVATHNGQRSIYLGIGGREVSEPMPSLKYERMVDCSGCHFGHESPDEAYNWTGYNRTVTHQGCIDCHGDDADDYWDTFQEYIQEVKDRLPDIKSLLARARAAVRSSSGERAERMRKIVDDAAYDIDFIEKSHGWAHNWDYSNALLDAAEEKLTELLSGGN